MPRPATGQVIPPASPAHSYALRFRALGKRQYVTLGTAEDGWTYESAAKELRHTMADVERGTWKPAQREPVAAPELADEPTFVEFASEWFSERACPLCVALVINRGDRKPDSKREERCTPAKHRGEWRPATVSDYGWQLTDHLLPFFGEMPLSKITAREVDRYRLEKVQEGELSVTSINKTITRLAQILETAVEYEEFSLDRNPAKGKSRRLKPSKPAPVWLDRAEHIEALLDAAGELDREARDDRRHVNRRALLSVLTFAGLRIGELCDLQWRDVDLTAGRITVRASKTDAGRRTVDLLPALRDELLALKASAPRGSAGLVFPTRDDGPQNPSNIRHRVLAPAVKRANAKLEKAEEVPLPERLTPHKLRHTFASLLVALGTDPGSAMDQLGHTDPAFTLRVYRHSMRRDDASKLALRRLVGLEDSAAPLAAVPAEWSADQRLSASSD